jgi:ubiquinone biosynthesis protein UbiJ
MLDALNALVAPAAMERLTLALNHVLAAEPAATQRLLPHRGRSIALELRQWPSWLPQPPVLAFVITPAGLLEWCRDAAPVAPDLHVALDAGNPAGLALGWLSGQPPAMDVQGDAALAGDVQWLADNLRWDLEADLERLFGPAVAHQLARVAGLLKSALHAAVQAGSRWSSRLRPEGVQRRGP